MSDNLPHVDPAGDLYAGIDFANREERTGRCFVRDDGTSLTVCPVAAAGNGVKKTGVDCPFGTSAEFYSLLSGVLPILPADGSCELRATERWVGRVIENEYETPRLWTVAACQRFGRQFYFFRTTHVQPSVGLRTVPFCLYRLGQWPDLPGDMSNKLKVARRGKGAVVEAHPRLFLYSMVERVRRANARAVTPAVLYRVAEYKGKKKKGSHWDHRRKVYEFLRSHPEWCGGSPRLLQPATPEPWLLASDHAFDAWLSALTAWATDKGETIRWEDTHEPGMDMKRVEIEGHMLILDHAR